MNHTMTPILHRLALVASLALFGCTGHDHDHAEPGHDDHGHDDHGHDHAPEPADEHADEHGHDDHGGADERSATFTVWGDAYELFVEAAPLAASSTSRWLIHATRLAPYEALEGATVTLLLTQGGTTSEFAGAPRIPGIYVAESAPMAVGVHSAVVRIEDAGTTSLVSLGDVTILQPGSEDIAAVEEESGGISFLKEQQWVLPFAVTQAAVRGVQPRFTVLGRVAAASGSDVELHAPVAGRLRLTPGLVLTDGAMVEAGALIGHVVPVPDSRDRIDLERDVDATRVALEYAELERDRVAPLVADGILSEARRNETDAAVAAAEVAHDGARRRLSNWSAVERGDSNGSRIAITAPIGGRISDSLLIDGAYVSADEGLARITDVAQAVIEAHIPETEVSRIPLLTSAIVYVASSDAPIEVSLDTPPIPAGRVDPATHTLAIRFALPPWTTVPASGLSARVMFGEGAVREVVAVPRSAVSDEDGIPVVYVQTSGEEFARRTVRTGDRDGEYVEVVSGISAGEWVVTEGAWLVRLAASQGAMPSHGHAH